MAAVVHARQSGRTQDFTSDRRKLLESVDAFVPEGAIELASPASGMGRGGDMIQRWSPTLMRSACLRNEPAVPALDAVTTVMATVPGRRKALVFLSVGVPAALGGPSPCSGQIGEVMRGVFRKAQVANVNIYAVDPTGLNGYSEYLRRHPDVQQRSRALVRPRATNIRQLQDFMRVSAETTGGRAVLNTNAIESAIDRIFEEDRSYYMVGYESSNGAPDGEFRKVEVRVNRSDVTIRTRSGYWAPRAEADVLVPPANSAASVALAGLFGPQGLPLRTVATPIGLAVADAPNGRDVDVAMVLTVKWPARAITAARHDTLTVIRHVYDATGNPGPPVREILDIELRPGSFGNDVQHDVFQRVSLPPGRYQIRFNAHSAFAGVSGSVYAEVAVPDVRRASLSIAGPVIGYASAGERPEGALAELLPLVPTTARDFSASDPIRMLARIYQGGGGALPVTMTTEVLDATDVVRSTSTEVVPPDAFQAADGVVRQSAIPLANLPPGPYLFSVSAQLPSGFTARKDIPFRVK
jgi:VWFA-related protein